MHSGCAAKARRTCIIELDRRVAENKKCKLKALSYFVVVMSTTEYECLLHKAVYSLPHVQSTFNIPRPRSKCTTHSKYHLLRSITLSFIILTFLNSVSKKPFLFPSSHITPSPHDQHHNPLRNGHRVLVLALHIDRARAQLYSKTGVLSTRPRSLDPNPSDRRESDISFQHHSRDHRCTSLVQVVCIEKRRAWQKSDLRRTSRFVFASSSRISLCLQLG